MYKVKEESAKQLCAYFEIFPEYMQILKINRCICESLDDHAEKLCKIVSSRLNEEQKNELQYEIIASIKGYIIETVNESYKQQIDLYSEMPQDVCR